MVGKSVDLSIDPSELIEPLSQENGRLRLEILAQNVVINKLKAALAERDSQQVTNEIVETGSDF